MSSSPSTSSTCSPTWWKPSERTSASDAALRGLTDATQTRAWPVAIAHSVRPAIASRA
jgi:hypothetical protein